MDLLRKSVLLPSFENAFSNSLTLRSDQDIVYLSYAVEESSGSYRTGIEQSHVLDIIIEQSDHPLVHSCL